MLRMLKKTALMRRPGLPMKRSSSGFGMKKQRGFAWRRRRDCALRKRPGR